MTRKLSISFDHDVFVAQKRGGVPRYFTQLARLLALGGQASVSIHAPLFVAEGLADLRGTGARVTGVHLPVFPGVTMLGRTMARLFPRGTEVDVAHATWYPAVRPRRCRYFAITVHDMIAEMYPDQVRGASSQIMSKAMASRNADLVFCVSENTKRDLVALLGVQESKIRVTPLASSIGETLPAAFRSDMPYILFVGNRQGYKNFDSLLAAYSSSAWLRRNFKLLCFGGPRFGSDADYLRAQGVEQLFGDDSMLAAAYRGAAVYMCPSRYEGFGLPVVEAMSCGCPVLAGHFGSLPEVGGEAIAYVEDVTPEAIRDGLEGLLSDARRLNGLREAGLARSQIFSWLKTAEETMRAYNSLVQ